MAAVLYAASAILAFVAAWLWLKSANVKIPTAISPDKVRPLSGAFAHQSSLSAWAARAAAAAALLQGTATLIAPLKRLLAFLSVP
jgi:hypothetical protein